MLPVISLQILTKKDENFSVQIIRGILIIKPVSRADFTMVVRKTKILFSFDCRTLMKVRPITVQIEKLHNFMASGKFDENFMKGRIRR